MIFKKVKTLEKLRFRRRDIYVSENKFNLKIYLNRIVSTNFIYINKKTKRSTQWNAVKKEFSYIYI